MVRSCHHNNCLHLGEWLINPRFVSKQLDVRIVGTTDPPWLNGRYERQIGYIVAKKPITSADSSIPVWVGYSHGRIWFRAHHLEPVMTTEIPSPLSDDLGPSLPLIDVLGARVVIIGIDLLGSSEFVGEYGLIISCPYSLGHNQACVQIMNGGNHAGRIGYFHSESLCRSLRS